MSRWTCPRCDREFGRPNTAHTCAPGCTLEECFAPWPPLWRDIYDALWEHVASLGPVHADVVTVGVFLLRDRKLAEVRPKARSLSLELLLPRAVSDERAARRIRTSADRVVHFIKLTSPAQIDATMQDWLTEAYDAAGKRMRAAAAGT